MMKERTTIHPAPLELPLWPPPEPVPVAGCAECAGLAGLRGGARARGDMSAVSDCNVPLRRHQEAQR
ncbi:hypothetical protein [Streptomyces sp. enrichment culture]|uniref:hypothetical protein n=1 Tax=Streptomyces sp. enrichment culture TaxID=1795815 RepID=UPI003F57D15A